MNTDQAIAKYLQAVEEHAEKLRAYHELLAIHRSDAPDSFSEWQVELANVRQWLEAERDRKEPLDLTRTLALVTVATNYSAVAWSVYAQLLEVHNLNQEAVKDEGQQAYEAAGRVNDAFHEFTAAFGEKALQFAPGSGTVLVDTVAKLTKEKATLEEMTRHVRPTHSEEFTISSMVEMWPGVSRSVVERAVKTLRKRGKINPGQIGRVQLQFTTAEVETVRAYIKDNGRQRTKVKIK